MKYKLAFFFCHITFGISSQSQVYTDFNLGKYSSAYSDTVIYSSTQYEFGSYSGQYPLFVQIWYPTTGDSKPKIKWSDMRKRNLSSSLEDVYQELLAKVNLSFIDYNVREDFPEYNSIDYGDFRPEQVFDKIMEFETNSESIPLRKKLDYPVIVYHHGSQGCSDENMLMAEYFASQGYVFISANFNLPYTDKPFGLVEGLSSSHDNLSSLIDFAKSISQSDKIYFIGHSWGAQKGWTYLSQEPDVKGFVSLETTIEFKSDTVEIKDKWAHVYQCLKVDQKKLGCPVLAIANTQSFQPFWFFEQASTSSSCFVSAKGEFGHESYTSAFFMRHFFRDQFPQPDSAEMQKQYELYIQHLELIREFLDSIGRSADLDFTIFDPDFFWSCME